MASKHPAPKVDAEEPAAKKAKAEEEAKKEEEPKFQEPDAAKDTRPAMTATVGFATAETTLNVVPTLGGKMLTCLSDGGMAYLFAGARANVGQKAGRYMFEAKIVQNTGKAAVRIGFSTSESSLVLGDASSVYFDSEGAFVGAKQRKNMKGNCSFKKDQVVAVVLNLDSKSPNANTVALYRDGVAVGEAMPLPESLHGKTLFPHLSYRSASVRVNFGATALKELPFKCRMLQGAAASDVAVAASQDSKDGKYEVCMPVAFPDEGTFEWLDSFLEKNPKFVELSDRSIAKWAKASGHHGNRGNNNGQKSSNDKPQLNTGIQELDNMSIRKVINAVAPIVPRNYLIMEVKRNLIAEERQEALKKFNYPCYKKVARVIMGEPSKEWKSTVQNKLLKDKQAKSDRQHAAKKAQAAQKCAQLKKQREIAKTRKEADKKRKAAAEEAKKKAAEAKAAKEPKKEGEEEKKEEKKEEPAAEVEEEEKEIVEEDVGEAPTVELTDDEKKMFFRKSDVQDLTAQVMSSAFGKFTCPGDDEGFDNIVFEWDKADKAKDYLQQWVLNKKRTTRIEDIKPGKDFNAKKAEFAKLSKTWTDKLAAFKKAGSKKPAAKEGDDDIDIFSVADICDVGGGVPLFEQFTFEDWELMNLRFQYCLLVLSFKADSGDSDLTGIPMDHLGFYFQKYYGQPTNNKKYGVADTKELLTLVKDVVSVKDGLLTSNLSDDLENLDIFLKLTEEQRRERQRRIDAGDETARLKFQAPAPAAVAKPATPAAAKPITPVAGKPGAPQKSAAVAAANAAKTAAGTPAPKTNTAKGGKPAWGKGKGKW